MLYQLTLNEYAYYRGITAGAVRKAIKMGHALPGVKAHDRFGRAHQFFVTENWLRNRKKLRSLNK